jgi:hypothetical protein
LRVRLSALGLLLVLAAGCLPPGADLDEPSDVPLPGLAEPAHPLPATTAPETEAALAEDAAAAAPPTPTPEPTEPGDDPDDVALPSQPAPDAEAPVDPPMATPPPPAPARDDGGATDGRTTDAGTTDGPASASPPAPVLLADVADPARDAGLEAPPYADLTRIRYESVGDRLRVTVEVAGDVPARLQDGEVVGLGIDLYSSGGEESDHQLFADGGSDGWRAFLHTPEGFVAYPGTFGMGGRRLVFEVPWAAVGGRVDQEASVFLDWSRQRLPLNATGNDRAPDRGRTSLRP